MTNVMLIIPELCVGGAQRSIANVSLVLSRHANVYVVIFNRLLPVSYPHGGRLISLDIYPKENYWSKFISFVRRIRTLRKLKRDLDIDVSISFLEGADYVNVLSRLNERVFISIRGSKVHDENMKEKLFFARNRILIPWLYAKADLLVTVNRGIANEMNQLFGIAPQKVRVIPNFYDIREIRKLSEVAREDTIESIYKRHKILVTSGRLAREKRLGFLLHVFAQLKRCHSEARLVFLGDGPERENLMKTCDRLGLSYSTPTPIDVNADIFFLGNLPNVYMYLRDACIYLMNSSSEGFPNGMVEAMVLGIPVVSSDCPYGPRELLGEGAVFSDKFQTPPGKGILLPLENSSPDIWVKALDLLLTNSEARNDISHAAMRAADDYDMEKVIHQWLDIISSES